MTGIHDTSFWVAVSTVLCFAFIAWKGHRPIRAMLDSRARLIQSRLEEAEALHREAQEILAEYKKKNAEALQEAETVLRNAQKRADQMREQMEGELKETIARQEASAVARLARLEQETIETVKGAVIACAMETVSRQIASGKEAANDDVNASLDMIIKTLR
jgi:F-type H+-transporting ATPase subunit b